MINWEELKHIHVIRKLEEILAQWFNTDIFIVDERGQVRNYDSQDRRRDFHNPLASMFFTREQGRQMVFKHITETNEKVYNSKDPHVVLPGPTGAENVVVTKIQVDNEFLGTVYAFAYADKSASEEARAKARAMMEGWGFDGPAFDLAFSQLRVLKIVSHKDRCR